MFLLETKTLLTTAMRATFDQDYPVEDFRDLWIDIEYPDDRSNYPGIWVDFDTTTPLTVAGINHAEYSDPGAAGTMRRYTRWRYTGSAMFTVSALSSGVRDRLIDEVIRVMAFGREMDQTSVFRSTIEQNDLIACNFDFDTINLTGKGETPGTPWGSNEVVFEQTIVLDCFGEFVSDSVGATLVPLSSIQITPIGPADLDPDTGQPPPGFDTDPALAGQWE